MRIQPPVLMNNYHGCILFFFFWPCDICFHFTRHTGIIYVFGEQVLISSKTGLCIIVFGISKWYWLSFIALLLSGVLDGISVVVRSNIMQLKTPDALRGRVMSVNSMFINSSNEIGQFESGVAAKLMGVVPSVVFGGCMTILVVVATWFKAPSLKKLEY